MSERRVAATAPRDGFDIAEFTGEPALYLKPLCPCWGEQARALRESGAARPLLGDGAWSLLEILWRRDGAILSCILPAAEVAAWQTGLEGPARDRAARLLTGIETPPVTAPGCELPWPRVMGILNVTPDSFSDGGRFAGPAAAIAAGLALRDAGADIVDVGGESTRPGAEPVPADVEAERVVPVIAALAREGCLVSVDTRHATVMAAAMAVGASIINDVTALTGDRDSLGFAVSCDAPLVLMHMRGEPRTMQWDPQYDDVVLDVFDELQGHMLGCTSAGIDAGRLVLDPGIGFGKTGRHNLELLADMTVLHGLGRPVLLGASRKSFIGRLDEGAATDARLAGSLAVAQAAADRGAAVLRVHDVAETRQMLRLRAAMHEPRG